MDSEDKGWAKSNKAEESTWGKKVDSSENDWTKSSQQSTWGNKTAEQSSWSKNVRTEENDWVKKPEESTSGRKVNSEGNDWRKQPDKSNWGVKDNSKENDWNKIVEQSAWGKEGNDNSWGKKVDSDGGSWGKKDDQNKWATSSSPTKPRGQSDWAATSGGEGWSKRNEQSSSWDTPMTDTQSTWGKNSVTIDEGKSQEDGLLSAPSGAQRGEAHYEPSNAAGWDKLGSVTESVLSDSKNNPWETKVADESTHSKATWGSSSEWGKSSSQSPAGENKESQSNNWGSSQKQSNDATPAQGWGSKNDAWGTKVADESTHSKAANNWGSSNDWGKSDSQSNNWTSRQSNDSTPAQGWGSPNVDTSGDKDARPQWGGRGRGRGRGWGRGRSREGPQGRGPSSDGDWKNRRPRPVDDPNAPGLFTATRQRLDSFTAEEQDVLVEIEPIMKSIRRVMHQPG